MAEGRESISPTCLLSSGAEAGSGAEQRRLRRGCSRQHPRGGDGARENQPAAQRCLGNLNFS